MGVEEVLDELSDMLDGRCVNDLELVVDMIVVVWYIYVGGEFFLEVIDLIYVVDFDEVIF